MGSRLRRWTAAGAALTVSAALVATGAGPAAATAATVAFTAHCTGPGPTALDRPTNVGVLAPDLVQPGQTFPVVVSIDYPISATATVAAARLSVQGADATPNGGAGTGLVGGTPGATSLSGVLSLTATGSPGGTVTVGLTNFAQFTIVGSVGAGQTCTPTVPLELARIAIASTTPPPPPPTDPTVSVGDASVAEGTTGAARVLQIPVTLSSPATTTVTVDASVHTGSATYSDLAPTGLQRLRFFPRPATGLTPTVRWVKVPIVSDPDVEGDESFTVTLTNSHGGYPILDGTGTGTILDDDATAAPSLAVGDLRLREGRAGTRRVTVPLTLSAPLYPPVVATVSIGGGTSSCPTFTGSVAPPGADCRGRTVHVRIPAGTTTAKVGLDLFPDSAFEPDETVRVTVTRVRAIDRPLTGPVNFARPTGIVTIRDDDSSR